MKLSKQTIATLKALSTISTSMVLSEGNILSVKNQAKTIMAYVEIPDALDFNFNLYDTPEFLSMLTLFNDPDLDVDETFMTITDSDQSIKYFNTSDIIVKDCKANPLIEVSSKFDEIAVSFDLTEAQLSAILKSAGIFSTTNIAVQGDGKTIKVLVLGDKKSTTTNTYSIDVGTTDKEFKVFFNRDNLKMISSDYHVELSSKGISRFTNQEKGMTFFVAIESDSEFGA